jgi:asparagine synthase (glutamine-hydrolysing)
VTELEFTPAQLRSWSTVRDGPDTAHATGWAFANHVFLSDESLARHILGALATPLPFSEVLSGLNGNFATVAENVQGIHLAVDTVRSIPLFYRTDDGKVTVSDDARLLYSGGRTTDERSAVEYATAAYVTGPHTLFTEVSGLQSGECVSWLSSDSRPGNHRYYRYACTYDAEESVEDLSDEFDEVLIRAFSRIIVTLDGRQAVIPLSGGLDSRLVASMLKRCGYDNVLCFAYGVPGNPELARSRASAEALGYPWLHMPYPRNMWRKTLDSAEMHRYWSFASNGVSLPHCSDWPAVKALGDHPDVSGEAVFVPGHTGDFITGGHLNNVFDPVLHEDPRDFNSAMVKKHYSLWDDLTALDGVRTAVGHRIDEALAGFQQESDEDLARMYEYWEWQERQAKLIINSVRAYEFFGYSWRIPLWDFDIMGFWGRVPLSLKMDKYLYRRYLSSHDPTGLFGDSAPAGRWDRGEAKRRLNRGIRGRIKTAISQIGPGSVLLRRFIKLRRYWYEYSRHPEGMASAYGGYRYLFREPSKRNTVALLLREFLQAEYGLELSTLRSRYENGVVEDGPERIGRVP